MGNIPDDQVEIINDFIQESRDMLDNLEPTIIELGQSCQKADCWSVMECSKTDCPRHSKSFGTPCWLDIGFIGNGLQACPFAQSESDCRSCEVFVLTNGDPETMNAIFRLFHSMKGSAGFLELNHIAHVAHLAENLLDRIRSGKIILEAEHVDLLCKSCDFAREALDYVEKNYDDQGVEEEAVKIGRLLEQAVEEAQTKADAIHETATVGENDPGQLDEQSEDLPGLEDLVSPEMLAKFIQEGDELLNDSEQMLLAWAEDSDNSDSLAELFRNIHSFKGNCGFFGFGDLEKLSHQMETVLDAAKQGHDFGAVKPVETLLKMVDLLRSGLVGLGDGGDGSIEGLDGHLDELKRLLQKADLPAAPDPEELRLAEILVQQEVVPQGTIATLMRTKSRPLVDALIGCEIATREQIDAAVKKAGQTAKGKSVPKGAEPPGETAASQQAEPQTKPQTRPAPVRAAKPAAKGKGPARPATKGAAVKRQDIRVDLEKLDKLINLIGEMVIAENMLVNNPDLVGLELENFGKASQQMSKIVRELQEMAMVIRMIPVSGLFRRMIRLVHDISVKSGKKVELVLSGEETEVDKTVIEQITDPLVHLLRNSLDHGLEPPDERVAAGKPEKGVVRLSAKHEEGEVWITVEDDGRGLNRDKILSKAIEKGLIQGDGADMSDRAVYNLIFQPGFSTADKITDISGRGVGMDVVRQNLEKIKGKIEVYSKPGQGSNIRLRIPLTLAIIDGLMIRVGRTRCILPLLSVREIFRPTENAITHTPDGQELVKLRENFVPVLRLHDVLRKEPDSYRLNEGTLVILEHQDDRIGLFVDEILGQQQTVIKGLSNYLGNVNCASGCTILGNGDVCLILDVGSLIDVVEEGGGLKSSEYANQEIQETAAMA